ncbi:phage portal protein [Priestia koreensis]|uniref:phage portal protein n=1 Tax=Priestia koreensis TaxID=284581 RepID=UPI003D08738F
MNLEQYIKEYHSNRSDWFLEEISSVSNQQRIMSVVGKQEYLDGKHKILQSPSYEWKKQKFEPRKIVLSYAKQLINFSTAYLLQNPVTLTGNERIVKEFQKIHKKGKYDRINYKLLSNVTKYGMAAEYVYLNNGVIQSKVIPASESYPIYNHHNELLAFIQSYIVDAVSYYTVYSEDKVETYDNLGGDLRMTGTYTNLSGLPIVYHNENELSEKEGRSDLDDYLSILDTMEELLSKFTDSILKFHNPIPVIKGMQLKDEVLPANIVGAGLVLDDGSEFEMVTNQLDYKSFEVVYKQLLQSLLDVSSTPAVSMNKTDISNLSEVSIKLLFSLANIKAGINEQFMRDGIEQRFEKIRRLLEYRGVKFSDNNFDSLGIVFTYSTPANDKEIIDNLKTLRDMSGISLETLLTHNPYINDVQQELNRLRDENSEETVINHEVEDNNSVED